MHLKWLLAVPLYLLASPAGAQVCTFTNTGLNWGNVNLASGVNIDLTGGLKSSCTGTRNATVRICPSFNAGTGGSNAAGSQRYMLNGANQLAYNIYSNSARSTVWGSYTWGKAPTPPSINLRLTSTTTTATTTMYGRIFSGQGSLPIGPYTSNFSGTQVQIDYAYSTVGNCSAIAGAHLNETSVPFTAQASYGSSCLVNSATTMNFGSHGVLDSNIDASNSINVTCASGTSYTISLSGGESLATDPAQRQMSDASKVENVTYGIYRDLARTLPWGDTINTNTVAGTGSGTAQTYTAYGRVPPQNTPTAQTYTDTVIVTVTY
jgi:spore coat protein U-like protein